MHDGDFTDPFDTLPLPERKQMGWEDKKMEKPNPNKVRFELDMDKILTIYDIKKVLKALDFHIFPHMKNFEELRPYVKQIHPTVNKFKKEENDGEG